MIVDGGANRWLTRLATDLYKGELGTGSTALASGDTDLATPASVTLKDVSYSLANRTLIVDYVLDSASGTGSTYQEGGVFVNSSSSTLFQRYLFPSITHSSTKEMQFSSIVRIRK